MGISVDIDVFDTGAIVDTNDRYDVLIYWPQMIWPDWIENFGSPAYRTEDSPFYFWLLPASDYYTVKFYKFDEFPLYGADEEIPDGD